MDRLDGVLSVIVIQSPSSKRGSRAGVTSGGLGLALAIFDIRWSRFALGVELGGSCECLWCLICSLSFSFGDIPRLTQGARGAVTTEDAGVRTDGVLRVLTVGFVDNAGLGERVDSDNRSKSGFEKLRRSFGAELAGWADD